MNYPKKNLIYLKQVYTFQSNQIRLVSWNKKTFFNEIEYDKLYPFGSAPARIYGTPKMLKFPSNDPFPKPRPFVSSIVPFNHNLVSLLGDLLAPLVVNDYSCKYT